MLKSYGICVGAANLTFVELCLVKDIPHIVKTFQISHEGNILGRLEQELNKIKQSGYKHIAITGRKIKDSIDLPWISEPEAVEGAFTFINKEKNKFDAIISMGAEVFIAYLLNKQGHISSVRTLSKCASGTGEFFMQQLRRMNISLPDAIKVTSKDNIYRLSSRCSVFCKSDCTHALNKGQDIRDILAGLSEMMARKVLELLVNVPKNNIMLTGAVALNPHVVNFLKADIKNVYVPKEAHYFEALGAASWALKNKAISCEAGLLKNRASQLKINTLAPLCKASHLVDYRADWQRQAYSEGDVCILGLDVGSTTTKAIMLRERDNAVLDSIYLRTNGNPIEAAVNCYKALAGNVDKKIKIIGLGVTGSGRQIVALHAASDAIVNEIIAHSRAAVYFDPEVDTIFEIGGQDAKYTYVTNGVSSDYAMNEACSAGTGSFLEESCKETLGVDLKDIEHYALKGNNPPNFNDQCAAFISSDIKAACQDGLKKEDIIAGLVYSICVNYNNRVKGNRIVGNKIFMQGGVCYNKAVPLAMASLLEKNIIVPPDPGLMGAFGVALEVKNKLKMGILKERNFDLAELMNRKVSHKGFFKCNGAMKCDRKCDIARIEVLGKVHSFGGLCNKYYNLCYDLKFDSEATNLVKKRQEYLFGQVKEQKQKSEDDMPGKTLIRKPVKTVGINKSFLTHILFPLYYNFFTSLGCKVIIPDKISDEGVQLKGASFCYPAEIAHGLFHDLLKQSPDYIFLPQILELKSKNAKRTRKEQQSTCVILQGESYYLRSSFKDVDKNKILAPVLDFSKGLKAARTQFLNMAKKMGVGRKLARKAYRFACEKQHEFVKETKRLGAKCLDELKKHPDKIAVVLLGRAYNASATEANMAIPDKFASRGITVIPFDCLPYENESDDRHMYWATGQMLLKAGRFVKKHPQLFATFITNFSCGPDSFIVGNVRDIMGKKPMLILEIDNHTADAGINTRIEAFLDIVKGVRSMIHGPEAKKEKFKPARCVNFRKRIWISSSGRERFRIKDPKVKVLIPAMGELGPQALSSVFRSIGINSVSLLPSDDVSLKYGRANTTCKECLPLILTAGGLIRYFKEQPLNGDVYVYFMPATGGNCRFGQYSVFLKNLIRKQRIKNLAVWSMDTQNSYTGLGVKFNKLVLKGAVISDTMYDIKNTLKVLACDRNKAMAVFDNEWKKILYCLSNGGLRLEEQLGKAARALKSIPLKYPLKEAKIVALMGEIYVRRDDFCCNAIIESLAQKGFVVKTAPVLEWLHYVDYLVKRKIVESNLSVAGMIEFFLKQRLQRKYEKNIKEILAASGLYQNDSVEMEEIMRFGKHLINEQLTGESIVVVGAALKEIMHSACGIINVGPFACLPSRIIEAILSSNMNLKTKTEIEGKVLLDSEDNHELAFLSIEVDGNPFPLLMDAKIEAFCLQAERLHKKIIAAPIVNS
ncbi:MAG: acyl-CoA dehydratase activase [Candidatus Omnitrophica bacterium]|jgi:predicted CoA-substrate-specific enzyme activase|nr:acyl-CoA dehydratase activase [Candidatus Omnitrophota bacterium]